MGAPTPERPARTLDQREDALCYRRSRAPRAANGLAVLPDGQASAAQRLRNRPPHEIRPLALAKVVEHHGEREHLRDGIGLILPGDVRRGAVDRLEVGVLVPDVP